ncbi:MAG TPA: hypothetical protein PLD02_02975, partial [Saprospiraceae bacterium]|nr:hypothetical protein [Saprospiraceae bacterium]
NKDSLFPALKDTVIDSVNTYAQNPLQRLLNENRFLNAESTATNFIQREKGSRDHFHSLSDLLS